MGYSTITLFVFLFVGIVMTIYSINIDESITYENKGYINARNLLNYNIDNSTNGYENINETFESQN